MRIASSSLLVEKFRFMSAPNNHTPSSDVLRPVRLWLFAVAGLVFLMVIVGGATRLTESGLSITEWKVVTGVIPPLTDAQWMEEFEKYKKENIILQDEQQKLNDELKYIEKIEQDKKN
mgnify:CR=1 FL=1